MATFIDIADLAPFADISPAKADAMIDDAEATAILIAPCITTLHTVPDGETEADAALRLGKIAAVKATLRAAILRWNESGTGAVQSQTVGPFGSTLDTRVQRRSLFWPSEIEQLQGICASASGGAFSIDTAPCWSAHLPWCSLSLGAAYCSCGVDIAGQPIYELG